MLLVEGCHDEFRLTVRLRLVESRGQRRLLRERLVAAGVAAESREGGGGTRCVDWRLCS